MLNMMFAGNVGGEVVVREVTVRGEQIKVANFSVAISNGKTAEGEDRPPTWIKVSVWRNYAQVVADFVKKGECWCWGWEQMRRSSSRTHCAKRCFYKLSRSWQSFRLSKSGCKILLSYCEMLA